MPAATIKINEIFYSIQGEAKFAGLPTVFIRTTGCPLRCNYCDTEYAFYEGKKYSVQQIVKLVEQYNCPRVCITGGEPLIQPKLLDLLQQLTKINIEISIETSGAFDISEFTKYATIIVDIKTPSSTESTKNYYDNLSIIRKQDVIKFVVATKADFDWSVSIILKYNLQSKCDYLYFSPSYQKITAKQLADWLLTSNINARLQLQIHKYIWGDIAGF